eukprot:NODE_5_length_72347_cov_1.339331.p40 type:complete len:235 gc:universal NODE_5_length_72347_cov_1.339331:54227-53523(-)
MQIRGNDTRFPETFMDSLPKELKSQIDAVIKSYPESKKVFQAVVEHFEPLQRKLAKSFTCVITKEKFGKLPKDLFKFETSKKRKILFTTGKTQHMFTCESSLEENATPWTVIERIALMHSGHLYLCDQGVALYYAKQSFAIKLENLKKIEIGDMTSHNCTLEVDGKPVSYFPNEKVDIVRAYCQQTNKSFSIPKHGYHQKRVLHTLMEDGSDAEDDDNEESADEEFKGGEVESD